MTGEQARGIGLAVFLILIGTALCTTYTVQMIMGVFYFDWKIYATVGLIYLWTFGTIGLLAAPSDTGREREHGE